MRSELFQVLVATWEPVMPEPITKEDAREIFVNITGFFSTLIAWAQEQNDEPDVA